MENNYKLQKKAWQQPELILINQSRINGGGPNNGFKEHGHNGGNYYVTNGSFKVTVGKAAYDTYVHS